MKIKSRRIFYIAIFVLCVLSLLYFSSGLTLSSMGKFLILDEAPSNSDAAVVLHTGVEYYPRIIEAAGLYIQGYVKKIVINGNRKTDTLRKLEELGLEYCCPWYEDRLRILELYGVPRDDVITISAEDVYDTITEARAVGEEIVDKDISSVLLVTSKSHTKRANHIWKNVIGDKLEIKVVSAKDDPYDPKGWWKSGRQIRWVLSEYGAWFFYYYERL